MKKSNRAIAISGCAVALISGFLTDADDIIGRGKLRPSVDINYHGKQSSDLHELKSIDHYTESHLNEDNRRLINYYLNEGHKKTVSTDRESADNGNADSRKAILTWHLVEAMKDGNDTTGLDLCLSWYAPTARTAKSQQSNSGLDQ